MQMSYGAMKAESATVQAEIQKACEDGWTVYRYGRYIVAARDGRDPMYLSGSVEDPAWKPMQMVCKAVVK